MEATAKATYVRISPRKVQIVLDLIRKQPADKAMAILQYTPKAACEPVMKVLRSAMAQCRKQQQYGCFPSVCKRLLCRRRPHSEENSGQSPGQSLQNQQENISHHHYR